MLKEIQTARLSKERKGGHSRRRAQWWKRINSWSYPSAVEGGRVSIT